MDSSACRRFTLFLLMGMMLPMLASCRSTNKLLKAKAAPLSPFVEQQHELISNRDRLPFHRMWWPRDQKVIAEAASRTRLYVAPVRMEYLRPVKKPLPRKEIEWGSIQRRENDVAFYLRNEFGRAFLRSPAPRYRLASAPGKDSVTLELALVELNPTSPKGNAVKTGLKFVVGPVAGLGGYFTKGNIAIEGKLRDSHTGKLLFQFADNEADKMTFYSLRDFKPYGHAMVAVREWSDQFELFTRTRFDYRVKDSKFFTLSPW